MKILCRFRIHSWKRWYRGQRSCRRCGKVETRFKGSFPLLENPGFTPWVATGNVIQIPPTGTITGEDLKYKGEGAPYKIEGSDGNP